MKKMNLKKSKKKKKIFKIKYIIYITIIYFTFSYTFYNFMKHNENITNEEFINMLVQGGNANIINEYKLTTIVNKTMIFLLDIDLTKPNTIMNGSILRFSKPKTSTISIEYNDDYSNLEELKEVSDYISDPNPSNTNQPIIYLYNSHQLENYSSDNLDIYGITPNVQMASYLLREKLNTKGIETITEDSNMSEILDKNNWDYSYSYIASRTLLEEKIKNYNSLKYFIDIHRDSVDKDLTTQEINGKKYAKILFVIGQDYSTWESNYKLAEELNTIINNKYEGLSRGILTKTGINVNGVYNQDINKNVLLIELGSTDNTIDEVNNTTDILAEILYEYIKGA